MLAHLEMGGGSCPKFFAHFQEVHFWSNIGVYFFHNAEKKLFVSQENVPNGDREIPRTKTAVFTFFKQPLTPPFNLT